MLIEMIRLDLTVICGNNDAQGNKIRDGFDVLALKGRVRLLSIIGIEALFK